MANFALGEQKELKTNNFVLGAEELIPITIATQAKKEDRPVKNLLPAQVPAEVRDNLKSKPKE